MIKVEGWIDYLPELMMEDLEYYFDLAAEPGVHHTTIMVDDKPVIIFHRGTGTPDEIYEAYLKERDA